MYTALMLGSGLFWTLTYLLIIRQNARDQTYGMPLVALCANLSWEFTFAWVYPHGPTQRSVNIVWFAFDMVIFAQVLRYGPREFPDLPPRLFYAVLGLTLATSCSVIILISYEFNDWDGVYAAFGQNLLMSVLFITMLYRRRSLRGQSIAIATCKLVGTGLASTAFYFFVGIAQRSILLWFLFGAILVYDLIYLGLVVYVHQNAAIFERRLTTSAARGTGGVVPGAPA